MQCELLRKLGVEAIEAAIGPKAKLGQWHSGFLFAVGVAIMLALNFKWAKGPFGLLK